MDAMVGHDTRNWASTLARHLHDHLLLLVVVAYVFAGVMPAAGLWIRSVTLRSTSLGGVAVTMTLPSMMLALLLFNAGFGVDPRQLRNVLRSWRLLTVGLAANVVIPLLFILTVSATLSFWHNPTEVQLILVGLALIASMPVAGSSTAWCQNANGDLTLSLGLVIGSTVLSPLTTPAVLHAAGWATDGAFADCLHSLAGGGSAPFLIAFVMLPSMLGIAARCAIGTKVADGCRPVVKLANSLTLLTLCYSNAAAALPKTIANPDWDFLIVMLAIVTCLCASGFLTGLLLASLFGLQGDKRASLAFGLGMTNNGTGLVLATTALAKMPEVMLPVIIYNLVQHVIAAVVQKLAFSGTVAEVKIPLIHPLCQRVAARPHR